MNTTDSFIQGLNQISSQGISAKIGERFRLCFIDYLACAIGGAKALKDSPLQKIMNEGKDSGINHIIGYPECYPMAVASLVNGYSSHYLELDDGHRKGAIHIGAPIFSALLAISEAENISCNNFIMGVVCGYESAIRLACSVQPGCRTRGYHITGVCGTVGAAIGAAIALNLSLKQIKTTISAAVTSASGLLEMQEDSSELKPYNAGHAAMDAVMAVYMGKAGFQGPNDPLGGKRGFLNVFTERPQYSQLIDFSSKTLQIETSYMKLYAACRHAHPAIEAVLELRERFQISDIVSIRVRTYKQATEGHLHKNIPTVASAKMSIPFCIAVALAYGNVGLEVFNEYTIKDDVVTNLMQKIFIVEDASLTKLCPDMRAAIVEVETSSEKYKIRVNFPKGEPENQLSREDVKNKLLSLSGYAGISQLKIEELIREVYKEEFSISKIISLLII